MSDSISPCFVGVDLGGTRIKIAIADQNGDLLVNDSIPTSSDRGPNDVLERIAVHVETLISQTAGGNAQPISALGMGVPGLVNIDTGTTKFLPNLPTQWRDVPVAQILGDRLGCPVGVLNDARTATLAELRYGCGKDGDNITLAFFTLGTGVGGGIIIDGKLRLGPVGAAGELGHQTILPGGPRCGCGSDGCLEVLASGPAIAAEGIRLMLMGQAPTLHKLTDGDISRVTTVEMVQAAESDPLVKEAIIRAASYIGVAAANLVTSIHPEIIVLGGGVAEIGELLTTTIKSVIRDRVRMLSTEHIRVEQSQLKEKAGVMGAVALAMDTLTLHSPKENA